MSAFILNNPLKLREVLSYFNLRNI